MRLQPSYNKLILTQLLLLVSRFDRVAKEDVVIQGKHLPKGQVVNALAYAVHHDPDYWEDPETFKPER